MIHRLKTWPDTFNLSLGGVKPFEVRQDDRGYAVGDTLCLKEWDPLGQIYTGRELTRRVTCILRTGGPVALPDGLVVMGVEDPTRADEQARLGALLHELAALLGVAPVFEAIEEELLLASARRVKDQREEGLRMLAALGGGDR